MSKINIQHGWCGKLDRNFERSAIMSVKSKEKYFIVLEKHSPLEFIQILEFK